MGASGCHHTVEIYIIIVYLMSLAQRFREIQKNLDFPLYYFSFSVTLLVMFLCCSLFLRSDEDLNVTHNELTKHDADVFHNMNLCLLLPSY